MNFHMFIKVTFVFGSVVTHAANSYISLVVSFYMANYAYIDICLKSTVGAFVFLGSSVFKIKTRI